MWYYNDLKLRLGDVFYSDKMPDEICHLVLRIEKDFLYTMTGGLGTTYTTISNFYIETWDLNLKTKNSFSFETYDQMLFFINDMTVVSAD